MWRRGILLITIDLSRLTTLIRRQPFSWTKPAYFFLRYVTIAQVGCVQALAKAAPELILS